MSPASASSSNSKGSLSAAVATGNWGCGAFHGDKYLKAVIQIVAAAYARRDLLYCTFGDEELCSAILRFVAVAQERKLRVRDMGKYFKAYLDYWLAHSRNSNKANCIEFFCNWQPPASAAPH